MVASSVDDHVDDVITQHVDYMRQERLVLKPEEQKEYIY